MRESGYDSAQGRFSVRFVTIGSQRKAEEFCGQHGMAAYCTGDVDKRSYAAMGLEQYNLLRLFTDPALKKRRIEAKAAGLSLNVAATKLKDAAQLPGAAIIDRNGTILWLYRGAHPGDLPPVGEMLDRARGLIA